MATGHVHELDDRGGREQASDQAHGITNGFGSEAALWLDEKVIRHQGEGHRCRDGGTATQAPGDGSGKQDEDQQKSFDARQPQGPCGQAQSGRHDGNRHQRHAVDKDSANHAVITIRN